MNAKNSSNTYANWLYATVIAFIVLMGIIASSPKPAIRKDQPGQPEVNRYADAILSYLANPSFTTASMMKQITGTNAELGGIDLDENKAYFFAPYNEEWRSTVSKITLRPERAEYAKVENDRLVLGNYRANKPGHFLFRISVEDFFVDPSRTVSVQFRKVAYTVSVNELADFLDDSVFYGGAAFYTISENEKKREVIANFGSLVAKGTEPSLKQLARNLVGNEIDPAKIAQTLLDFVTNEIEYDKAEERRTKAYNIQTIRRPVETLFTKKATCGSKVALYASLLEQVGIPYWIAYYPTHVSVFVKWPREVGNRLYLKFGQDTYALAETTTAGFAIGRSRLAPDVDYLKPEYMQIPSERRMVNMKDSTEKRL